MDGHWHWLSLSKLSQQKACHCLTVLAFPCGLKMATPLQVSKQHPGPYEENEGEGWWYWPYLVNQKKQKSSQSPQQPSIFVSFARICLLTTREAEKVPVLALHTLFSIENWCCVAREGQAGGCTELQSWSVPFPVTGHHAWDIRLDIFFVANGDPLLVGQSMF